MTLKIRPDDYKSPPYPASSYFLDREHWLQAKKNYKQHIKEIEVRLFADLKEATSLPDSFIKLAWQEGHRDGPSKIIACAEVYAQAIKEAKEAGEL